MIKLKEGQKVFGTDGKQYLIEKGDTLVESVSFDSLDEFKFSILEEISIQNAINLDASLYEVNVKSPTSGKLPNAIDMLMSPKMSSEQDFILESKELESKITCTLFLNTFMKNGVVTSDNYIMYNGTIAIFDSERSKTKRISGRIEY